MDYIRVNILKQPEANRTLKRPKMVSEGKKKMPECPGCGLSWEYCVVCGEPCSDNEESTPTLIHGEKDTEQGGIVCDNCKDREESEDKEDGDGEGD